MSSQKAASLEKMFAKNIFSREIADFSANRLLSKLDFSQIPRPLLKQAQPGRKKLIIRSLLENPQTFAPFFEVSQAINKRYL
jgi:hypothetical protein